MLYTVKEVAELSGVTIKALHHYHRIGLLLPKQVSEAGYRLYGTEELERLQEILLYRELDFPLDQIKAILERHSDRISVLTQQEERIRTRKRRLDTIMETLRKSIASLREGTPMDHKDMFKGLESKEEWDQALAEQNQHLQQAYGMEPLEVAQADIPELREQAAEAAAFMNHMAESLRQGLMHSDAHIEALIRDHLEFLNKHGHDLSAQDFAAQSQFFLSDGFHLKMLEGQQTGLAYYLAAAAQSFALRNA